MPRQPWKFWLEFPDSLEDNVMASQPGALDRLATWGHDHRPSRLPDDIVQDAWSAAATSMNHPQLANPIRSLRCWLAAKTQTLVVDEARRQEQEATANQVAARMIDRTVEEPLTAMLQAERALIVQRLIEALHPRRRAVVRGRLADLDDGRIAETVVGRDDDRARAVVRKLFQRACDDLRTRVQGFDLAD
jgi:DNA-directed RNA polymerase specialized sigma24 family protein